jgi:hypothetical protein
MQTMAKRSSHRKSPKVQSIVVRPMAPAHHASSRPIIIREVKAPKHTKGRRHHGGKGSSEKHRVGAILGAAVLGLIDKSQTINLPTIPFLGKAGTAALAAWGVGKYMHSQWADQAATGMACIAAYELAKEGHIDGMSVVGDADDQYVAGF